MRRISLSVTYLKVHWGLLKKLLKFNKRPVIINLILTNLQILGH